MIYSMDDCFFSEAVKKMAFSQATAYFGKDHGDAVDFSLGEPKDRPPDSVVDAYIKSLREGGNRYAPVQGLLELRGKISEKLKKQNGVDATPDEILITNGATEGIAFSVMSLVNKGDEVVVVEPSYPIIAPMVNFCGGKAVSLFLNYENSFLPDLEKLKDLVNKKTKMLVINTPHNPTGAVFDERCLKAMSEIFGGVILVDEVYENFTYGVKHSSLASIADIPENVITVNSFSKTYCMCGYRTGYLHAGKELIRHMLKLKLCMSTCTSNPAQHAAVAALEDVNFPGMIRKRFEERRGILVSGLNALGLPFVEPKGAFYVFPNITEFGNDIDAFELFLKAGVLTMPGSIFHEKCKKNVRFSFVVDKKEILEGIERLEGVLA